MSLTPIESAEALEQALAEAGDELVYVGFFGAFSAVAEETRPHFEAFAKESGARCLVVDLGVADSELAGHRALRPGRLAWVDRVAGVMSVMSET